MNRSISREISSVIICFKVTVVGDGESEPQHFLGDKLSNYMFLGDGCGGQ